MIKILEHGTKKITTCEDCGCKFSYDREDIELGEMKYDPFSAINGDYVSDQWLTCPQCKKKIILEASR